ncbi:MAG: FG-GAP repeat protein, partial [Planctomycetes bacterium]|nr:FG-GAP repeat protein [Planctomycetota bacterium]
ETRVSGFYPQFTPNEEDQNNPIREFPLEPFGARIIGVGFSDEFGTSITFSSTSGSGAGDLIVSAPARTARGIEIGVDCPDPPTCGGEIDGLGTSVNSGSGVAYLFPLRNLWTDGFGVPPRPHQYIVGEGSHCGGAGYAPLIENIDATRIAGFAGDQITNIVGIDDFNNDGLSDFASGAPNANGGRGRVYIAFRRSLSLEGDFVLDKLALSPNAPERLTGALIVTGTIDGLGSSLATGVDFNHDGISDLVIGSPNAAGGVGEIIVVFGDPNLRTPENGISVDVLLSTQRADGSPRAARITGNGLDVTLTYDGSLLTPTKVERSVLLQEFIFTSNLDIAGEVLLSAIAAEGAASGAAAPRRTLGITRRVWMPRDRRNFLAFSSSSTGPCSTAAPQTNLAVRSARLVRDFFELLRFPAMGASLLVRSCQRFSMSADGVGSGSSTTSPFLTRGALRRL